MRQREEPAPVAGEDRRQREVVHDAGEARRVGERALGVGQGVIGGEQLIEAEPGEVRQAGKASRHQRPGEAERNALRLLGEAFAEQRGAAVGRCRGKRHMIGVVGQT